MPVVNPGDRVTSTAPAGFTTGTTILSAKYDFDLLRNFIIQPPQADAVPTYNVTPELTDFHVGGIVVLVPTYRKTWAAQAGATAEVTAIQHNLKQLTVTWLSDANAQQNGAYDYRDFRPQEEEMPALTAEEPLVKPVKGVAVWDPFPDHVCETCEARRATYTDEDKAEAQRKWVENNQVRIEGAITAMIPRRQQMEQEGKDQRKYWSMVEVEKRIAQKELDNVLKVQKNAVANLANNRKHHEEVEELRLYNLPEKVAEREAAQAAARAGLLAFMARYNTEESVEARKKARSAAQQAAWDVAKKAHEANAQKAKELRSQRDKGRQLLQDVIGKERWDFYDKHGFFFFMGEHGQKYRIDHGYSNNIWWYETPASGTPLGSICGYPSPRCPDTGDLLPHEDLMAGQFLATVQNEKNYLQISICHGNPTWYKKILADTFPIPKGGYDYDIAPDGSIVPKDKPKTKAKAAAKVKEAVTA